MASWCYPCSVMRAAFVRGVGAVSALGRGAEALWRGALEGRVALRPSQWLDLPEGEALPLGQHGEQTPAHGDRAWFLLEGAVAEALEAAGWGEAELASDRCGLVLATTKGGIGLGEGVLEGRLPPSALHHLPLHTLASRLARQHRVRGPVQTVSLACASGTAAAGQALRMIRAGRADRVLVAAVDALSCFVVRGFSALHALDPLGARPFDRDRGGLTVGEAAAAVALDAAPGRSRIGVRGFGCSNDAHHVTGPARDGAGLVRAIVEALADAGIGAEDIGGVSAHGTGTRFNDAMESAALGAVFGPRGVPVHGIKGAIGHTMGASGLLEVVLCARALDERLWPPTAGVQTPDPQLEIDLVRGSPRELPSPGLLSTSSGFSGINAAVVLWRDA